MDYKNTLNLPQTDFPMKASLPQREPEQVKRWNDDKIYRRMVDRNKGAPLFVMHDGPPYANGNIHIGHTLNKVLKDIVVKYRSMSGNLTEFIPGWDCHGLPIELGVEKKLQEQKIDKRTLSKVEIRKHCKDFAMTFVEKQREQFKRLGVLADWENPYLTMSDDYVASIVRELGRIAKKGNLTKGNKPVYWCSSCATALADAEIEYHSHQSPSIFVKFFLQELSKKTIPELSSISKPTAFVIWTTTPWTLPANLGIALHPDFEYVAYDVGTEALIIAEELVEKFCAQTGVTGKIVARIKGAKLERLHADHPFAKRTSLVVLGTHVTLEAGTGAVHTAPGHGVDDYKVGLKYGLEAFAPVDQYGKYTDEVPDYQGKRVTEANEPIVERLKASGHLIKVEKIEHSYPHCWRCHKPVIFRATPQWFITMEKTSLRTKAVENIHQVEWIPHWGINRILGMVESRPDWCVSRQRVWGVPITVFYCESCNEALATEESFQHVAGLIDKNGPNIWYEWPAEKLIKPGSSCRCGEKNPAKFRKETDILDVWFDSGVSHAAVLDNPRNKGKVHWPADLYLEGSDQHRGWFQTSLLTGVETRGQAPFRKVLTHGFVNDKEGKKMSKSKGNVTDPLEFASKYGAEILRLWVVLEDYRDDLNFSMETIDRVSESYRKIRNTFRYILGNLYDFDPKQAGELNPKDLCELDQWALKRTEIFLEKLKKAYDSYEFHTAYHAVVNFCAVDLSSLYFDILKDRLYTSAKNSKERKSSQKVLFRIGEVLATGLAPILSFTTEEFWGYLKKGSSSVFEARFPALQLHEVPAFDRIETVFKLREQVNKVIEEERAAKRIGHSLETSVHLKVPAAQKNVLEKLEENLARLFIVSNVEIEQAEAFSVTASKAKGTKCARCWVYSLEFGKDANHPLLCNRCVEAVS